MRNNTFFKLFILMIIAVLFRFSCIDKPEGLWNDEYVSWFIASEKDIHKLLNEILSNCHMPLYYLYLRIWMFFFSDSDLSLRISSVIPSLMSIPVIYFIGKEFNKKTAYIAASFTVISSFCIYFAQEVRFYSLLFLFTSLCILYFIKFLKNPSKKNLVLFLISNGLIISTHTLGLIYSFFSILLLMYYFYEAKDECKQKLKYILNFTKYLIPFVIFALILSPLLYEISISKNLSQFWANFSLSKIIFTLTDYFTPVQTNISNSPESIIAYIYHNKGLNYSFIIFALVPLLISVFSIVSAIRAKNKILNYLLFISIIYFLSVIYLSLIGRIVLSTKYSSEIYPALIIAFSYGISVIKKEKLINCMLLIFFSLHLIYLLFSPEAAQKLSRPEGQRAAAKLIEYSRLKEGDIVILTYYDVDKFQRYLKKNYEFSSINKFNFNTIMFNNDDYFETIKRGKYIYKNELKKYPNSEIVNYSKIHYISRLKKGDRIGLLLLDNVSFLSDNNIQKIIKNNKEYEKTPFMFLVFSSLKNSLMYSFKDEFKIDTMTQSGDWTLIVYQKK